MKLGKIHSVEISGIFITQILREINFGGCRSCKTAGLAILGDLKMINLVNFSLQKMQKFLKIKIQRLKMCLKMEDFAVLKSMKLISRKI